MSDPAPIKQKLVLQDEVTPGAEKAKTSLERLQATIAKFNKSGVGKAISSMQDWGSSAIKAGVLATAAIGTAVTVLTAKTVDFSEKSRLAFSHVAKSGESGEELFQRSISLAQDLGLDVQDTTKQIIKFRALQFSQGKSEDLIKMGADMKSLGASTEQVQTIYGGFGQIMSKGVLGGRQLLMLAQAGVSTKLVYEQLSKSLGKSVPEIQKLIKAGKINADQGIDAIGKAILQKTHTHSFGEAGKQAADATMSGLIAQFQSRAQGAIAKLADVVGPSFMGALKTILDQFSDFGSEENLFGRLGDALQLVARIAERGAPMVRDFFEGFASGLLSGVTSSLGGLAETFGNLNKQDVAKFGKQLGTVLGDVIVLIGKCADVAAFFTTPLGRVVFWLGAITAAGYAVAAALTPVLVGIEAFASTSAIGAILTALAATLGVTAGVLFGWVAVIAAVIAAIWNFRSEIGGFFVWIAGAIDGAVGGLFSKMFELGSQLMSGLWQGIKSMAMAPVNAVKEVADGLVNSVESTLQIHSPSRVFHGIGENVVKGFAQGVANIGMPAINSLPLGSDVAAATAASNETPVLGRTASIGASVGGSSKGSRGDNVFAPVITVPISGKATKEDGHAFGEGLATNLRKQWHAFTENTLIEQGG